ncbi:MAG: 16S rRNA (uracil(1498)-N(3))-methyltransferase [Gammaproteobacteria bacterium]|nr:16S rRNA (uracil(1498)-N(3))-methyltransferase [Gammaproteobacteria bacterium]
MQQKRLFHPGPLASGAVIAADRDNSHYLSRVLRLKGGDEVTLINGEGGEYSAEIVTLSRNEVTLKVGSYRMRERESPLASLLIQALSRGEKMDFTIQKSVELGVTQIIPVVSERSVVRIEGERQQRKQEHWQGIATAAALQCGRNRIPQVEAITTYRQAVEQSGDGEKLILSPRGTGYRLPLTKVERVTLVVGPEGGLTAEEEAEAQSNGFKRLSLGPRILRTESAALTALAVLQWQWGDLSSVS